VLVLGVAGVLLSLPLSLTEPQLPQGVATERLLAARPGDGLPIPQHEALAAFYRGEVTILPQDRLGYRIVSPQTRGRNVAGLLGYLLLTGGGILLAWWLAPARLPGMERRDYPFATIDGTAAPPPPGKS